MKKLLICSLFLIVPFLVQAQVPNGSFENWTLGDPDGWVTSNVQGVLVTVTQTNDAHTGSSAAQGGVVQFYTQPIGAVLQTGPGGHGFAISQRYTELKGFFKFAPIGGDRIGFQVAMSQGGESNVIGQGATAINNALGSWTEVSVPINYTATGTPDLCIIQVLIFGPVTGNDYHVGSIMYVDDISLSGNAVDVNDPGETPFVFSLDQNYPNPFNPSTSISYSIPEASNVLFTVFDALGKEVYNNSFYREAGNYKMNFDASSLPSGIYFYNITAGQNSSTKKFVVLK